VIECLLLKPVECKCVFIMENVIIQTEHLGEGKEKIKLMTQKVLCVDAYIRPRKLSVSP
jgi:hypothetical protein